MSRCITVYLILMCITVIQSYKVLDLKNPTTKYGFVYPNRAEPGSNVTYVLEGVDVLIYLAKVPDNYAECKITTQDAEITFTLIPDSDSDAKAKVAFWTPDSKNSGCGARIKNVTVSDTGRWRLQAVNDEEDHLYQSFINLKVIKNFDRPDGNFTLREGLSDEFNITKYASYCEIDDPVLLGDQKIFENCQVDLENINKLYSGKWKAKVGVLGKIDEIVLQPRVEVLGENFDVGFNKTGPKINLFCNIRNAVNMTVTFCRFIKEGSDYGLRLSEGLSNGNYSYFGRQLKDGDCGVTIEDPKLTDYGIWKCSLGIHRIVNDMVTHEVKEAIVSLSRLTRSKRAIENKSQGVETLDEVVSGVDNPLKIYYKADFQIKYCIVKHPNRTIQYAINGEYKNENWTTIGDINVGECGMSIFKTSTNEEGVWEMQIGYFESHMMDKIVYIPVRIGKTAMIAVDKSITAQYDSKISIRCKAVPAVFKEPSIIEYCRFTLPDGNSGFKIDQYVTEDDPIDGLYYYNGTSLEKGDCQVTIIKVSAEHYGQWQCSGKIKNSKHLEDFDTIDIVSVALSVASISGIAVGAAVILMAIVGFIYYRRKQTRQQSQPRHTFLSSSSRSSQSETHFVRHEALASPRITETEIVDEIEMGTLSHEQDPGPSTSAQFGLTTTTQFGDLTSTHEHEHEHEPSTSAHEHEPSTSTSQSQPKPSAALSMERTDL